MRNEMFHQIFALLTGALLGVVFFGGLWFTVLKMLSSKRPAVWLIGSLFLRMGITIAGFYFVSNGRWDRLLFCLLGFFVARVIANRVVLMSEKPTYTGQEVSHAPQS